MNEGCLLIKFKQLKLSCVRVKNSTIITTFKKILKTLREPGRVLMILETKENNNCDKALGKGWPIPWFTWADWYTPLLVRNSPQTYQVVRKNLGAIDGSFIFEPVLLAEIETRNHVSTFEQSTRFILLSYPLTEKQAKYTGQTPNNPNKYFCSRGSISLQAQTHQNCSCFQRWRWNWFL